MTNSKITAAEVAELVRIAKTTDFPELLNAEKQLQSNILTMAALIAEQAKEIERNETRLAEADKLIGEAEKGLEIGKMCANVLVAQGGAMATEIFEEELPAILSALAKIQQYGEQNGTK